MTLNGGRLPLKELRSLQCRAEGVTVSPNHNDRSTAILQARDETALASSQFPLDVLFYTFLPVLSRGGEADRWGSRNAPIAPAPAWSRSSRQALAVQ